MKTQAILAVCGVGLAAGPGLAQSFNIDIDSSAPGAWQGAPAATFGGAAAQAGTWNVWRGDLSISIPLSNLSGAATAVTITASDNLFGGNPAFAFNNAATTGDVQLLMDDGWSLGGDTPVIFTVAGLSAGTYQIYTYAWAPDFPNDRTTVDVTGANQPNPQTSGGGAAGNVLTTPGHYVVHTVVGVPAGGSIVISPNNLTPADFGTVNGIQIKRLAGTCAGDVTGNGAVDVDDLVSVILTWGQPDSTGVVDVDDLVNVILHWGPCG